MVRLTGEYKFNKFELSNGAADSYIEHIERSSLYKMVDLILEQKLHHTKISRPPFCEGNSERHRFTLFVMKQEELKEALRLIDSLIPASRGLSLQQVLKLKDLLTNNI